MNFRLFVTNFHSGLVNQFLHLIGFGVLFYGAFKGDFFLAISGYLIQEIGHLYNHFFVFRGTDKRLTTSMVPLQLTTGGLLLLILYLIYGR